MRHVFKKLKMAFLPGLFLLTKLGQLIKIKIWLDDVRSESPPPLIWRVEELRRKMKHLWGHETFEFDTLPLPRGWQKAINIHKHAIIAIAFQPQGG